MHYRNGVQIQFKSSGIIRNHLDLVKTSFKSTWGEIYSPIDYQALVYLNAHKNIKLQVNGRFKLLHVFDFDNKYRLGSHMVHVETLSQAVNSGLIPGNSVHRLAVCIVISVEE